MSANENIPAWTLELWGDDEGILFEWDEEFVCLYMTKAFKGRVSPGWDKFRNLGLGIKGEPPHWLCRKYMTHLDDYEKLKNFATILSEMVQRFEKGDNT